MLHLSVFLFTLIFTVFKKNELVFLLLPFFFFAYFIPWYVVLSDS